MRKNEETTSSTIVVTIARLGSAEQTVTVPVDATVRDALNASGLTIDPRAEFFVSGEKAEDNDILDNGDILSIVTPKEAGLN